MIPNNLMIKITNNNNFICYFFEGSFPSQRKETLKKKRNRQKFCHSPCGHNVNQLGFDKDKQLTLGGLGKNPDWRWATTILKFQHPACRLFHCNNSPTTLLFMYSTLTSAPTRPNSSGSNTCHTRDITRATGTYKWK